MKWIKVSDNRPANNWYLCRVGEKRTPMMISTNVIADVGGKTYAPSDVEYLDEYKPSYTKEELIEEIGKAWEAAIEFYKQEERSVVNSDIKVPDKQSYINNLKL